MTQPLRIQRRRGRSPMRTRRVGAAFRPGAPVAKREPFPGMNFEIGNVRADNARGTAISTCIHALLLLLLFAVAYLFPAIREEILPVQIIKEAAPPPPPPPEPERVPCPLCGGSIHPDATRCVHCMKKIA